jgi:hypothetical protein
LKQPFHEESTFELSRIYSQGWTTAKRLLACRDNAANAEQATALNPYRTAEERAHWAKGFVDGLDSPTKPFTKRGGNPWRAPVPKRIRGSE